MDHLFEKLLKEKIALSRDMILQGMTVGSGYSDFPEYKYNLGMLHALDRTLEMIAETQDDIRNS